MKNYQFKRSTFLLGDTSRLITADEEQGSTIQSCILLSMTLATTATLNQKTSSQNSSDPETFLIPARCGIREEDKREER